MNRDAVPLSTEEHWSERWRERRVQTLFIDPRRPPLRDLHRFLQQNLPSETGLRFLELGCYPGKFLWYFDRHFGYRVSGLENVPWCCEHARELLERSNVQAEIIEGDLMRYEIDPERRWDIVASFGLVEHFSNLQVVIRRHADFVKPGGHLVLSVPNHQGIYGWIMHSVAPEKHRTHTLVGFRDLELCVLGIENLELVAGAYLGRLGFWNCGIYPFLRHRRWLPYQLTKSPLRMLERTAQWLLPNTRVLAPNFALIARKKRDER